MSTSATTNSTSPASSSSRGPATPSFALGPARVCFTDRSHGDLGYRGRPDAGVPVALDQRRRAVVDRPWTWLHQVHGAAVVVVGEPGEGAGSEADASVGTHPRAALSVLTADCAPVALASPEGVIGVAHAGWRGLVAGVIEAAVDSMRALGATEVEAALGPCIRPGCYEFGEDDLAAVVAALGDGVRSTTASGRPALDVPAAVAAVTARAGASLVVDTGVCTACSPDHFSYRARGEVERQAAVVWLP